MNELILHHYPASPFAEKIRLVMGLKGLAWRSVTIPWIMPKPDLVALTGGYRKTPVLQIGADVYCDTSLIAAVLDERQPSPPLLPEAQPATVSLAELADRELFAAAVAYVFQPAGFAALFQGLNKAQIDAFVEDRKLMRGAGSARMNLPEAAGALHLWLRRVADHFADGRPYLMGSTPSLADVSVYHPLWFVRRAPALASVLGACPGILPWMDRMAALGHGSSTDMTSAQALEQARAATPLPTDGQPWVDHHGCQPGDEVVIEPTDTGTVPVSGQLVISSASRLGLRRVDERAGEVVVHFPRLGFRMRRI